MSKEILINVTPQETRVALVENGILQEVHIERVSHLDIVGNIYKGIVLRILPGMQAAFVDIGLDRAAFLHLADIRTNTVGDHDIVKQKSINHLLSEGQNVLVQVIKDALGSKGARLTMHITIPTRYLVYLPFSVHIGVSQKIEDEAFREQLKEYIQGVIDEENPGGYILRTMSEVATEDELLTDLRYLNRLWNKVEESKTQRDAPALLHQELPLVLRTIRDIEQDDVEKIRIDSKESHGKARSFASEFIPDSINKIEYYPGEQPIFDLYSVEDEIQKALDRKVLLKSGGYLIVDQTEAMTTIDVNTGGYVGRNKLEETIYKTNLEASHAIARQLRLRNLGGMIIIDFIDMQSEEHKSQVARALEKALSKDRTKVSISEISQLGLVEITRKRTRESLEHVLCEQCGVCHGRGFMKTPQTVCYEIFRDIMRQVRQFDSAAYMVMASQVVIDLLLEEEAEGLARLQEFIDKPVHLQVESTYQQDQFDVVLI